MVRSVDKQSREKHRHLYVQNKVCHQNIRSLLPKIDQVRALLESHKGISILGVTESHLSNNVSDTELSYSF